MDSEVVHSRLCCYLCLRARTRSSRKARGIAESRGEPRGRVSTSVRSPIHKRVRFVRDHAVKIKLGTAGLMPVSASTVASDALYKDCRLWCRHRETIEMELRKRVADITIKGSPPWSKPLCEKALSTESSVLAFIQDLFHHF